MIEKDAKLWVAEVINKLPVFLDQMKDEKCPGRFKYSLTGDIKTKKKWGLGNTVFAVKTYYMLNKINEIDVSSVSNFIKSFQAEDGAIYDPVIQKKSRIRLFYSALRNMDFGNIFGKMNKRAETRQSFAALYALNSKPDKPYLEIKAEAAKIKSYIHSLNWKKPWSAASHFSHLIFFLKMNFLFFETDEGVAKDYIDFAFDELSNYKQTDGTWCESGIDLSVQQKINGGMKIMTAYSVAERDDFGDPEKLIDLCLGNINNKHACDNFNIICLLYYCLKKKNYRLDEVRKFCLDRLAIYKKYWFPEHGGFSFNQGSSNKIYYGAKISKGKCEPDIHGTHLFLWGITLISSILGWDEFDLQLPIT